MPSQYNELQIIEALLPKPAGVYVDVGAGDPWQISNTGDLYIRGWSGLLVEVLAERCDVLRRARPRDAVVNMAASDKKGSAVLRVDGDLSSLDPAWRNQSREWRVVEADTLSNILAAYSFIRDRCDLCSIDVEGHELEVLRGVDFTTFRPLLFVIEAVEYPTNEPRWADWEPILLQHGYEFVVAGDLGVNRFYRRKA